MSDDSGWDTSDDEVGDQLVTAAVTPDDPVASSTPSLSSSSSSSSLSTSSSSTAATQSLKAVSKKKHAAPTIEEKEEEKEESEELSASSAEADGLQCELDAYFKTQLSLYKQALLDMFSRLQEAKEGEEEQVQVVKRHMQASIKQFKASMMAEMLPLIDAANTSLMPGLAALHLENQKAAKEQQKQAAKKKKSKKVAKLEKQRDKLGKQLEKEERAQLGLEAQYNALAEEQEAKEAKTEETTGEIVKLSELSMQVQDDLREKKIELKSLKEQKETDKALEQGISQLQTMMQTEVQTHVRLRAALQDLDTFTNGGKDLSRGVWVDAEALRFCLLCDANIENAVNRQWCRHCGRTYCDSCCEIEIPIPTHKFMNPVPCCTRCVSLLQ
jgi:chromosome segregation ATPase